MFSNKNSAVYLILWWSLQMHRKYIYVEKLLTINECSLNVLEMNQHLSWLIFYFILLSSFAYSDSHWDSSLNWDYLSECETRFLCSTLSLCSSPRHYRRGRCAPHGRQYRCPRRPWWCSCWPPPPCCGCSRRRGLTRGTGCCCPAPRQPGTANIWNARRSLIFPGLCCARVFFIIEIFFFQVWPMTN